MRMSDWSSDVCSSDRAYLAAPPERRRLEFRGDQGRCATGRGGTLFERIRSAADAYLVTARLQRVIGTQSQLPALVRKVAAPDPWWSSARRSRRSEAHTSELQSLMRTSYAVICLKKKRP